MSRRAEVSKAENAYAKLMLILLCSGGSLTVFQKIVIPSSSDLENPAGNVMVQLVWTLLYFIGASYTFRNSHGIWKKLSGNMVLLSLIGFAFLSSLWSEFPALTSRRCIALSLTTLMGLYFASRYSTDEIVKLLSEAMLIAAFASVFFAIFLPDYGVDVDGRHVAWNGLFNHKNHLARAMFLGVVAWGIRFFQEKGRDRIFVLIYLFICVFVMYKSRSATTNSILLAVVVFSVLRYAAGLMPKGSIFWATMMASFLAVMAYALVDPSSRDVDKALMSVVGRDSTLTGRTILWDILEYEIDKKPLCGYGYSAYWLGERGPSRYAWEKLRLYGILDEISHSHNGFIDIVINLGYIGLAISILFLIQVFFRSLALSWRTKNIADQLPVLVTLVFIAFNFSERQLLAYHAILWVLVCTVSFKIADIDPVPSNESGVVTLNNKAEGLYG